MFENSDGSDEQHRRTRISRTFDGRRQRSLTVRITNCLDWTSRSRKMNYSYPIRYCDHNKKLKNFITNKFLVLDSVFFKL